MSYKIDDISATIAETRGAAISEQTETSMQELSDTVSTLADNSHDLKTISDELRQQMEFFKE